MPVNLALQCTNEICGEDVRFTINATYTPELRTASQAEFFRMVPPDQFIAMTKQMTAPVGTIISHSEPQRTNIGNHEGYIGKFDLKYKNGEMRHLLYGIAFNQGNFYHLQLFSSQNPSLAIEKLSQELFSGFKITN